MRIYDFFGYFQNFLQSPVVDKLCKLLSDKSVTVKKINIYTYNRETIPQSQT